MSPSTDTMKERFHFISEGLAPDALHVVRFSGHEGLNTLYNFEITLVSKKPVDTEALLFSTGRLEIDRADGSKALFTGTPGALTQGSQFNGWTFYTLTLQSCFHQLTRLVFNRIHLDKTVQQIVENTLHESVGKNLDFAFKLQASYTPQEFTMQWNESVYDYLTSKLERDGIYYYFEQQDDHEKLVFTDSHLTHPKLPATPTIHYSPTSGLESVHYEEVISSFTMRSTSLPRNVILRDYDWMRPNTPVEATAEVSAKGIGNLYFYGDGFITTADGKRLAAIRAESLSCRAKQFFGESSAPSFRPGYLFKLDKHYDGAFNREYLLTEITHEGSQEGYLSLVLGVTLEHPSNKLYYRNAFVCIPSDAQYRPERVTTRNRVSGVVNAFVDTSSDSGKPEIDKYGRYKLVFPQDISGNSNGKASCWVRRSQPYLGAGFGSSFPLSPGVEVLVAFMDGDPDRPFITGAVSNAETQSVDNSATGELSGLYTAGGNGLVFHETDEKQGLNLKAGRSGVLMASGDLDATVEHTDITTTVSGLVSNKFSGMAQKMTAGFASKLSVGIPDWTFAKRYPLIFKTIQLAANLGKACDEEKDHALGWTLAAQAAKTLNIIECIVDMAQKEDHGAYCGSLTVKNKKSSLRFQSQITSGAYAEYLAWATVNFLASGAPEIAKAVEAINKLKEKAQKVDETELNFAKNAVYATASMSTLRKLMDEVSGLVMLARQKHGAYHQGVKKFGGLAISAPETNVIMAAKESVQVSSNAPLVLQTLPGCMDTALDAEPENLWKLYRTPSPNTLTTQSVSTAMHTAGNATAIADNQKIVAVSELELTTKFDKMDDHGKLFSEKTTSAAAGEAHYTTAKSHFDSRKSAHEDFSSISMKKEALHLNNTGYDLTMEQTPPQKNKSCQLTISQKGERENSLLFSQNELKLLSTKGSELAGTLHMDKSSVALSALKNNAGGSLLLSDQKVSLGLADDSVLSFTKSNLTAKHSKIAMEAQSALEMKAPTCKLACDSITLGKGSSKIEITSASITVNGSIIKLG